MMKAAADSRLGGVKEGSGRSEGGGDMSRNDIGIPGQAAKTSR